MQRLGIVDLGSNTARLVVYDCEPGAWFRLVDQIRERTRLGTGIGRDNRLRPEAIDRAVAFLRLIADYASNVGLSGIEVLGTSALRDAENSAEFRGASAAVDLEVNVLSGEEEARLGALAVANGFEVENAWVVDLGGGSVQISRLEARRWRSGRAYPLGAVRLTEAVLVSDPPKRKEIRAARREIERHLGPVAKEIRRSGLPVVAIGGTIRNLARSVQRAEGYPLIGRLHGYRLERAALDKFTEDLLLLSAKQRATISGISPDRADIVPAGALVFQRLMSSAGLGDLWISGHGVREGALYRRFLPPPHLSVDIRQQSVRNLLSYYAQSKEHVDRIRLVARRLFDELTPLHGLGPREADLLDAAAALQDIGLAVNFYRHDHHGAYVVGAAQLNGFSHREQALLAKLVRYHLKGRPKLGRYQAICRTDDEKVLTVLAACLRLAEHLERPRGCRIRDLDVSLGHPVEIALVAEGDPSLELRGIEDHRRILSVAFDREFSFTRGGK